MLGWDEVNLVVRPIENRREEREDEKDEPAKWRRGFRWEMRQEDGKDKTEEKETKQNQSAFRVHPQLIQRRREEKSKGKI